MRLMAQLSTSLLGQVGIVHKFWKNSGDSWQQSVFYCTTLYSTAHPLCTWCICTSVCCTCCTSRLSVHGLHVYMYTCIHVRTYDVIVCMRIIVLFLMVLQSISTNIGRVTVCFSIMYQYQYQYQYLLQVVQECVICDGIVYDILLGMTSL